jgi:hypothetical protein
MQSIIFDSLPDELLKDAEKRNTKICLGKSSSRNNPEFDKVCADAVYRRLAICLDQRNLPCKVDYRCTNNSDISNEVAYRLRRHRDTGYIVRTGILHERRRIIVDEKKSSDIIHDL